MVFSVPYTDIKILALIDGDGMKGAIYNPCQLTKPMPWLDRCPHCREGRQGRVPVKIRRAIQVLCSARPGRSRRDGCDDGYRLALPNGWKIWAGRTDEGWTIRVRKPDGNTLHVVKRTGNEPIEIQEPARGFRSPILLRTLRMLFSAQVPSERDVQAILLPLRKMDPATLTISQRTPCRLTPYP